MNESEGRLAINFKYIHPITHNIVIRYYGLYDLKDFSALYITKLLAEIIE